MLNFDNVEDLVANMFENLDEENHLVTVVSNKELNIEIMRELLNYNNVILNSCEIDDSNEYDREYMISILYDVDSDNWYVNVEKSYLKEKDKYLSTYGYVLFHEDVNSKAIIDMQNNEFMPLGNHDWFVIGEDDEKDLSDICEDGNDSDDNVHGFTLSKTDDNGYHSLSFYTTNNLSEKDIHDMIKNFGFTFSMK